MKSKSVRSAAGESALGKLQAMWPALKGSLARVYKPCTRPGCPACARGEKHANHLLAFTERGKRRCMYVPAEMVPVLRRALANGRRIERLLYGMGPALLREYRDRNPARTGPAVRAGRRSKPSKS